MPRYATIFGLLALTCVTGSEAAQQSAIPDLGLNGRGWSLRNGVDFTPVPGSASPTLTDPAHPYINNAIAAKTGQQQTFHMGDLSNPNLKQWAKDIMKKGNDEILYGGKVAFTASTACLPWGVPAILQSSGPYFFLQTPTEVVIVEDEDYIARHVYLNVPHSKNPKPSWYGESVGHYENGDTLVIDTIGFNTKTDVDFLRTPHTDQLHVVERWKVIDGGKNIELDIKVEDPGTYNAPWELKRTLRRDMEGIMDEYICAEGNFNSLLLGFDYGIPFAKKADF